MDHADLADLPEQSEAAEGWAAGVYDWFRWAESVCAADYLKHHGHPDSANLLSEARTTRRSVLSLMRKLGVKP